MKFLFCIGLELSVHDARIFSSDGYLICMCVFVHVDDWITNTSANIIPLYLSLSLFLHITHTHTSRERERIRITRKVQCSMHVHPFARDLTVNEKISAATPQNIIKMLLWIHLTLDNVARSGKSFISNALVFFWCSKYLSKLYSNWVAFD